MHCVRKLMEDIFWVGADDRRISLFENVFPVPEGISYNSYLIKDEKNILIDTVDKNVGHQFFENLEYLLDGKPLNYIVVNHTEPDHCATLKLTVEKYPEAKIIGNKKTMAIISQLFDANMCENAIIVEEGDIIRTGKHSFTFFMAPMVHWPEVMVTYDMTSEVLFSADAFGAFGAINGNIFADQIDINGKFLAESRRYYSNIVGKYGTQVQQLLKKICTLDIKLLCPLHGPVWRENLNWYLDKYEKWSKYEPEEKSVMIAFGSAYGNTENAVEILASKLSDAGIRDIAVYDVSSTDLSVMVSEAFRCSHIVFAATTYNNGLFWNMETLLTSLKHHGLQNRTVALIENGSWNPASGNLMCEMVSSMKNMTILDERVTIKSSVKKEQFEQIEKMSDSIISSLK